MNILTMILGLCCLGFLVGGGIMLTNTPLVIEIGSCYDELHNKMVGLECELDSFENNDFLFLLIPGFILEIATGIVWFKDD